MLSGLKFIPRDEIEKVKDGDLDRSKKEKKKSGSRRDSDRRKKRRSRAHGSSSEDDVERIEKGSRKKKKWYSSDEDVSASSDESESDSENEPNHKKGLRKQKATKKKDDGGDTSQSNNFDGISRKEMGLEWMLRPKNNSEEIPETVSDNRPEEVQAVAEDVKKVDPRELNPYLKNEGTGYPEDMDEKITGNDKLFSSSLVGDGGASWRLKALKRAQEQAAREGRKLNEVVEERWKSLGDLTVSLASRKAAPTHAHLHAIKSRRSGMQQKEDTSLEKQTEKSIDKAKMRVPKVPESLSWGKRRTSSIEDASVSAAMSSMNSFSNDGSFMQDFMRRKKDDYRGLSDSSNTKVEKGVEIESSERSNEDSASMKPSMSANQLAAKVLQLRMKGKHEEAEKLLKEAENTKAKPVAAGDESYRPRIDGSTSRCIMHDMSARRKSKEDDGDLHLAQSITRNQKYGATNPADDEYDYDGEPRRKGRKKEGKNDGGKSSELTTHANRFLMQQDRCQFCFENPKRPKHLVVAIANFSYLSLPNWEPVVPGHCCILTTQHEAATRSVDNNVWDEIRNFKKCLIMMFAQQEKDVVFLETVMGLSQQRRHCLVECIPVPQEVAGLAPVYFKKAIDEAEEEWSQHNAKKLIDTSEKGLRASIPKNFPYFHVEFGLKKGFVHVIDDETQFKSNFGLNVVRGMLRLPAEDMHRRRKHESVDVQKLAVAKFVKDWEPFDWTKQLG